MIEQEISQDQLVGVMGLTMFWNRSGFAGHIELMDKPWCDKEIGDLGFTGGGIDINQDTREKETPVEALERELRLEWGLQPLNGESGHYVINPVPLCWWETKKGWVQVHVVLMNKERMEGNNFGPKDEETICPMFISTDQLAIFGVRGGFEAVVKKFEQGNEGFVLRWDQIQGEHIGENGRIPANAIFVAGRNDQEEIRLIEWETTTI